MGGRGSSSGKGAKSGGKSNSGAAYTEAQDAQKLSQERIDRIDLSRYDIWQGAREYSRQTKEAQDVELTKTQRKAWYEAKDGNFSGLDKYSVGTLAQLVKKSNYELDRAERSLAKGGYSVKDDFITTPYGKRVEARLNFPQKLKQRQEASRINNEIISAWEKKSGKDIRGRVIESSSSKNAEARNRRQVELMFKGRK